jgi:ABC-2 type transport system permease protein
MGRGLLVFAAYTVIFGSVAWARFTSRDITA